MKSWLILFLVTPSLALAQEGGQGGMSPLIGLVLMVAIFWLFIIMPQSRKQKKHQEFISKLEKGDEIVTSSGVYGKIHGITDRVITLEVAPNVRIRIDRNTVAAKPTSGDAEKAA